MTSVTSAVPARRHLFEFEDLGWFPGLFRNAITDWLAATFTGYYDPVAPLVARLLEAADTDQLVDLCAGGSGPWGYLKTKVDADLAARGGDSLALTLTDKYPNVPAYEGAVARLGGRTDFVADPVDAREVPADLAGVRTIFGAFHHLRPEDAKAVLADAAGSGRAIGVFEMSKRDWHTIRQVLVNTGRSMVWTRDKWLPPKTWQLPLAPLIIATSVWDAVVSQWRAYTVPELEAMSRDLGGEGYHWEAGRVTSPERPDEPITYLIGYPIGHPILAD